jgi:hypothetical protein
MYRDMARLLSELHRRLGDNVDNLRFALRNRRGHLELDIGTHE